MSQKAFFILFFTVFFILVDIYVYQSVKVVVQNYSLSSKRAIIILYWCLTILTFAGFFYYHFAETTSDNKSFRTYFMTGIFINYFSKIFVVFFLLVDDILRLGRWIVSLFANPSNEAAVQTSNAITRSEFLSQAGIIAATLPLVTMSYGLIKGAHDYRIIRQRLILPNLPKAFHGICIAQISDIHAGSFLSKRAVKAGIEMLVNEKPDILFHTGDLVNYEAKEMNEYMNVFDKVKAPLGVHAVLGNHDYGEYKTWNSAEAKQQNMEDLKLIHRNLGWNLLLNQNKIIELDGEQIALIGVENWGRMKWSQKYGNLEKALKGTEETAVKLLLSHDPSHWEAQVLNTDVDVTFSGHTHGFQFGIEIGNFKWSPAQYAYKQWAGLYTNNNRQLYVNRGFGYLGFPGRIGMPPEITVFELSRT